MNGVFEATRILPRPEDRLIAVMEAAEICGLVGAGRASRHARLSRLSVHAEHSFQLSRGIVVICRKEASTAAMAGRRVESGHGTPE